MWLGQPNPWVSMRLGVPQRLLTADHGVSGGGAFPNQTHVEHIRRWLHTLDSRVKKDTQ